MTGEHQPPDTPRSGGDPGASGDGERPPGADRGAGPAPGPAAADSTGLAWTQGKEFGPQDKICMGLLLALGVFGLVMLPLRPVLLGMDPFVLVVLTGSRTGMVLSGALAAVGEASWLLALVVGTLSVVKFDLLYWWAGRLWGDLFVASLVGKSKGAMKRAKRAESVARRYAFWAMALTYLPIPIPSAIIYAVLGAAGMSLRRFVLIDLFWAFLIQSTYLYVGFRIGRPAVELLREYERYSWYVAIVIVVFIVIGAFRGARKQAEAGRDAKGDPEDADAHDDAASAPNPGDTRDRRDVGGGNGDGGNRD